MGILDDAIREHLELKRKHGVPEEEVERQQEEALGPARREVAQQPEDAEITADEAAPAAATDDGDSTAGEGAALFDGEQAGTPVAEEHEAALTEPPADVPPVDDAPPVEPPVADHTGMEAPPPDDPSADDPSVPGEPDRERAARDDTEPHGFPAVEDEEEPEENEDLVASDPETEDVLEDTPDFLQETPEHDRLWFEQKPPRDFDFD
jgi:hypothetical protein